MPETQRCNLWKEEYWPVHEIEPSANGEFDVPTDLIERYQAAMREFRVMQELIVKFRLAENERLREVLRQAEGKRQ